ncbi:MAG: hypothetical protein JKY56_20970, partial [Kofleriaceae bacterium]|nr:hypothetical protein [Kofleriaceae bacterium]
MLETIKQNIENYGFHVYHIENGSCPGFSYTIGLLDAVGAEVVFAGGAYFEGSSVGEIINGVAGQLLWHSKQGVQGHDLSNHILSVG